MLIEFSVENFMSIRDKVTFSMVASKYYKNLDKNLIITNILKNENLLKSALIYGANASGKTNVIFSLNKLKTLVLESHMNQKGDLLFYDPFRLDDKYLNQPTKFEITFIYNEKKYNYYLSYDNKRVIEEKLYVYPKQRRKTIFERTDTNNYYFTEDKKRQKYISESTLENVLYLSKSTKEKYSETTEAFDWFSNVLYTIGPANQPGLLEQTLDRAEEESHKNIILKALEKADFNILNFTSKLEPISFEKLPEKMKNAFEILIKEVNLIISEAGGKIKDKPLERKHVFLYHQGKDIKGKLKKVRFDFDDESEGTKRMLRIIGPFILSILEGRILILDELDTKLHHLLQIFLIGLFNDNKQNQKNAQLIFTTHNMNLLDQDIFRRDQIWFTEKEYETNKTDLYSLSDFKVRKDKDILKAYRTGRYGAIPFIKNEKVI